MAKADTKVPDDLKGLAEYFKITPSVTTLQGQVRKREWRCECKKCKSAWMLPIPHAPGNILHLFNHAFSHNR